jgi:hypothetical protein
VSTSSFRAATRQRQDGLPVPAFREFMRSIHDRCTAGCIGKVEYPATMNTRTGFLP